MNMHFLVFPTETVASAALPDFREDGRWIPTYTSPLGARSDLDVIGQDPRELDQAAGCYDGAGQPIWKQHTGFFVNLMADELAPELDAYRVTPATPLRTFG